jgi:superoxide dismutase, Cu-Zn family
MRKATRTAGAAGVAVAMAAVLAGNTAARGVGGEGNYWLWADGRFLAATEGTAPPAAVTYDEALVPHGAGITVGQRVDDGRMVIEVEADGVRRGHTFGVHVHTDPCGADPDAAGDHYQDRPGEQPWRANPHNEVWLDFTADEAGSGGGEVRQEWIFRDGGARSVVLHEHVTDTGLHHDGAPGDAGDRVACFTVPFAGVGE